MCEKKEEMDICHMEGKKLYSVTFMSFRFSFILFRKQDREAQKLNPLTIPTLAILGLYIRCIYVHIPMRCSPAKRFRLLLFLSMPPPYQTLLQFSPRRTYGRMSVRGDSTRHRRSPLPSTVSTHRRTFFIHALYVVKQYNPIVLVAVTLRLHQTDIHAVCTLVSKVSSDRGGTRSSVGKNHSTRIPPSARITADECPFNISSGPLRVRCSSRSMLENHHRSRA